MVTVKLHVKFRAFFITFAEWERMWVFALGVPKETTLLDFHFRGVDLNIMVTNVF